MLPHVHRLRTSAEFGYALRSGARFGNRNLVVFLADLPSPADPTIVGFLVSKKVGNAVVRNRVKRRLRELAVGFVHEAPAGYALIVRALPPSSSLEFEALAESYRHALRGCRHKHEKRQS